MNGYKKLHFSTKITASGAVIFVHYFIQETNYVGSGHTTYNSAENPYQEINNACHVCTSFRSEVSMQTECHHSDVTQPPNRPI